MLNAASRFESSKKTASKDYFGLDLGVTKR